MKIAVFCASATGTRPGYVRAAAALGEALAAHGHTLVYGGARTGLMGALADAALAGGSEVVGVLPDVPLILSRRHPGLTSCVTTATMAERKAKMIELADAFVALPGGPGTLDEVSEILSLQRLGLLDGPCALYDVDGFYEPLRALLERMAGDGFVPRSDFDRLLITSELAALMPFVEGR